MLPPYKCAPQPPKHPLAEEDRSHVDLHAPPIMHVCKLYNAIHTLVAVPNDVEFVSPRSVIHRMRIYVRYKVDMLLLLLSILRDAH